MNEYNRIHPYVVFFVKQKTAYELRISDWSSDVCSSDRLHTCSSRAKPQIPVRAPYEGSGVTKEAKLHKSAPGLSPSHCQPPPRRISSPHVAPLEQRLLSRPRPPPRPRPHFAAPPQPRHRHALYGLPRIQIGRAHD